MKKAKARRPVPDLADVKAQTLDALVKVHTALAGREEAAQVTLATFVNVALRIMAKTNASKIADEIRTEEVSLRMSGVNEELR